MVTEQEIITAYHATGSIRATAKQTGFSAPTVRKILITAGEYASPRTDEIKKLMESGLSVEEIARELNCTISAIHSFLPYSKGCYAVGEKTENAKRIAACRQKQAEKFL